MTVVIIARPQNVAVAIFKLWAFEIAAVASLLRNDRVHPSHPEREVVIPVKTGIQNVQNWIPHQSLP
jgi:hypothetical protein